MANVQNADSIDQFLASGSPFIPGRFIAHRMGRKIDGGETIICNLDRYQDVIEHRREDQVITVGGGISVARLNEKLAEFKQWLPIAPAHSDMSVSDCLLSGDAGYLEPFCGGMRRLALGVSLLVDEGEALQFGGKVVKNVTGYDITKLVVGSYGVFGVPVAASLRLYALPEALSSCIFLSEYWDAIASLSSAVAESGLAVAAYSILGRKTTSRICDTSQFALCLQVAGQKIVVEESLALYGELAKSKSVSKFLIDQDLEHKRENEHFQALAQLAWQSGLYYMDVSSSKKIANEILKVLGSEDFYEYRPGPQRLRIYSDDLDWFAKLALEFKEISEVPLDRAEFVDPIAVSYPVQGGYLQTGYLNESLSTHLYKDLKAKLDPRGLLNPFIVVN